MKNLLEFILIHLVEHPDDIVLDETTDDRGLVITINVNPADMGRVIGKQGSVIKAIRTIMRIRGIKEGNRVYVTIADHENPNAPAATDEVIVEEPEATETAAE